MSTGIVCSCSNPECAQRGCALQRRLASSQFTPTTTYWPWLNTPPPEVTFEWTFGVPAMRAEEV